MDGRSAHGEDASTVLTHNSSRSNLISMISRISLDPVSAPSRKPDENRLLPADQDLDNTSAALSLFVLEACSRQLRQYHLSTLDQETVNLNIGQGLDYSVDISKTDDGELVAVKHRKIEAENQSEEGGRRSPECARIWQVLEEIQIMMHPPIAQCMNVLLVKGFGWDYVGGKTTTPSLVVEFAQHGNLRQCLKAQPKKSESERWDLLSSVSKGLLVLHRCGIVHGDVKMENILVSDGPNGTIVPKIADFGSSIITTSGKEYYPYWGTDIYNAPEVRVSGSGGNSVPRQQLVHCDVWAFGLLCLEVALYGQCYLDEEITQRLNSPHMEGFEESCLRRLDQAGLCNSTTISKFTTIVTIALKRKPKDRGTFDDMKDHFFDQSIVETYVIF
jgi:serine/threonine protein kinase